MSPASWVRTADADQALVAALQAALAGEHAAVWACGRAAAELPADQRTTALDQLDAHRAARDALRVQIAALGVEPVSAAAAYAEPTPVRNAATARLLLVGVNDRLAATYADLAAATTAGSRTDPVQASVRAARRAIAWGGSAQAFPGAS